MMDRHEAYRLLAENLEGQRIRPFAELEACAGKSTSTRAVGASGTEYIVDVSVSRVPGQAGTLRVHASVDVASSFRLERVEDEIVVSKGAF